MIIGERKFCFCLRKESIPRQAIVFKKNCGKKWRGIANADAKLAEDNVSSFATTCFTLSFGKGQDKLNQLDLISLTLPFGNSQGNVALPHD